MSDKIDEYAYELKLAYDDMPCGVIETQIDKSLQILYFNKTVSNILGYTEKEMQVGLGNALSNLMNYDEYVSFYDKIRKMGIDETETAVYKLKKANGGEILVSAKIKKMYSEKQQEFLRIFFIDYTEYQYKTSQELINRVKLNDSIIKEIGDNYIAIHVIDLDNGIVFPIKYPEDMSDAFSRNLLYEDVMEYYCEKVVHPEEVKLYKQYYSLENLRSLLSSKKTTL